MLVLSAAGAVLSLLLLVASVRGWRRRRWSPAGRLHFTVVALASLAVVWSWRVLGLLAPQAGWPSRFPGVTPGRRR